MNTKKVVLGIVLLIIAGWSFVFTSPSSTTSEGTQIIYMVDIIVWISFGIIFTILGIALLAIGLKAK